jgi:ribonucleoside-diphosphate reductase alpha chain
MELADTQTEVEPQETLVRPLAFDPTEMSTFARSIYEQKYAWRDDEGKVVEDWPATAYRVVSNVLSALGYDEKTKEFQRTYELVRDRKLMPGGRYLYASGRPLHQVQNCLLMKAEDSREGWAMLGYKAYMALMTGAGIGVDYSDIRPSNSKISKTGGVSSGPLALMRSINEIGRGVMQGGARRSAIWAGLNWKHKRCLRVHQDEGLV